MGRDRTETTAWLGSGGGHFGARTAKFFKPSYAINNSTKPHNFSSEIVDIVGRYKAGTAAIWHGQTHNDPVNAAMGSALVKQAADHFLRLVGLGI